MNKGKSTPAALKKEVSIARSSAAEYLSFIAASGQGGVEALYADESIWLTQKMMGMLYDVETHTINYHLKQVFADSELEEFSVIRKFRITAADGKNYDTQHYNLPAIIAVGYKVNSERAVQFRKWATGTRAKLPGFVGAASSREAFTQSSALSLVGCAPRITPAIRDEPVLSFRRRIAPTNPCAKRPGFAGAATSRELAARGRSYNTAPAQTPLTIALGGIV